MSISVKIVPGETNRVDLRKLERLLSKERQERRTSQETSGEDGLVLPKGLENVIEKYSKLSKKTSRSSRDDYDLDDDFIDDSEAVDLGQEDDVEEELEQDFYICSEELEEPLKEEGNEPPSGAREGSVSIEDSFSEQSQTPFLSEYTYEEMSQNLEPIPEEVKSCVVTLKEALESNNMSKRSFTSTYIAPYVKDLFVTAARWNLAQKASFGDNGAMRCSLTARLWSHIKALFNCRGLGKYRCSKRSFEEEAFSVFHSEWKNMMRNEKEQILSELKNQLKSAAVTQSGQEPVFGCGDAPTQVPDSHFSGNSMNETQTQGSEGAEEDYSTSPTKRRKRKAATMAAEEISNLAVHGSTQSPLKKKKLQIEWSKVIDKLVYDYFVKKIAQIRCRDLGKSKKNENTESAAELLAAAFTEYDVTEKDLIDSYRRHKAELKRSKRQESEEKREEKKRKKELAAQKKLEREQTLNKSQGEQQSTPGSTESKEQDHMDTTTHPNARAVTEPSTVSNVHVTLSEKVKNKDTELRTPSTRETVMDSVDTNGSGKEVVRDKKPLFKSKVHNVKRKWNTDPISKLVLSSEKTTTQYSKHNQSKSLSVVSNTELVVNKQEAGLGSQFSQGLKAKPKKQRIRNHSIVLNEKIFKELPSTVERPVVTQSRIPAGFAAEVEAAVE